jgi:WD40 repeat protein
VSCGADRTIIVWDLQTGGVVRRHRVKAPLLSVAYSRDGSRFLSGGHSGILRVWDARAGTEAQSIRAHFGWIQSVAWLPGEGRAVSGGNDGSVCVWSTPKKK